MTQGACADAEAGLRGLLKAHSDPGMIGRETVPILARLLVRQGRTDAAELLALADQHALRADVLESWCRPVRAMRSLVDLMSTLTEDRISGAEAVDLLRPLWDGRRSAGAGDAPPEVDIDTMLTAWAAIAEALAEMVATERRENGRADCSPADVWGHLQLCMVPVDEAV